MASYKPSIIETIFKDRFDPVTRKLSEPIVMLEDVAEEIRRYNKIHTTGHSSRNPANFFKDFIRNRSAANNNWPKFVFENGYTGRQLTTSGACFEFLPITIGQEEPFPSISFAQPNEQTPKYQIESVSLPLASRRLGRKDETWMIQVISRLRIVEAHFSLSSVRSIKQLDLLQIGVKLKGTEIDAIYLAHEEIAPDVFEEVIVTCEAKVGRDDILEDQIIKQAKAPFQMKQIKQNRVIPLAVKCVQPSTIFVVEFDALTRDNFEDTEGLTVSSQSLFEIKPPVPGICQ